MVVDYGLLNKFCSIPPEDDNGYPGVIPALRDADSFKLFMLIFHQPFINWCKNVTKE